jgi:hypothetical protein
MQGLGKSLSASLTLPLLGIGVASVKVFADIEKLQKGLESVMGSSEAAAAEFELLKEVAKLPGLGLEEAVSGSVNLQAAGFSADQARKTLLAFGNALATVGKGARELDLVNLALTQLNNKSGGFGQDLRQLTEQLPQLRKSLKEAFGTADTDEISRSGISGAEVVQRLTAEFEKLPKVTGGINNAFENFSDSLKITLAGIGEEISEAFNLEEVFAAVAETLQSMIESFKALDPNIKKTILVFAGIAAAIGPVLLAVGALVQFLPVLLSGFAVLSGPIGLVVAGITAIIALIVYNWKDVKKALIDTANYWIDLYNESMIFRASVEAVILTFKLLWGGVKLVVDLLIDGFKNAGRIITSVFGTIGDLIKAVLTGNFKEIPKIFANGMKQFAISTNQSLQDAGRDFNKFTKNAKSDIANSLQNVFLGKRKKIENIDVTEVQSKVEDAVVDGFAAAGKRIKIDDLKAPTVQGTSGNTNSAFDAEIAKIQEFIQTVATTPQQIAIAKKAIEKLEFQKALALDPTSLIVVPDPDELAKGLQKSIDVYQGFQTTMVDIGKLIAETVQQFKENLAVGFGEMIGQLATGAIGVEGLFKGLLGIVGDFMVQLGKSLIAVGIASEAFKKALLQGPLAIAAGIALVALGTVFKSIMTKGPSGTPAFADGGIVGGNSYYGDKILARLNSGELVANRDQQKALWGMINPSVTASDVALNIAGGFEIEGSKLRLVLDRADKSISRKR